MKFYSLDGTTSISKYRIAENKLQSKAVFDISQSTIIIIILLKGLKMIRQKASQENVRNIFATPV